MEARLVWLELSGLAATYYATMDETMASAAEADVVLVWSDVIPVRVVHSDGRCLMLVAGT